MKFVIPKAQIKKTLFLNGHHYTVIVVPAADAYSQPTSYKVKSAAPLGQTGQEITCNVTMSGFVREKPYKDKDTGQQKIYDEQVVNFEAELAHSSPAKQ